MLWVISKQYWKLTVFKEVPENTPYSPFLLTIVACLFFLLIVCQWFVADLNHELTLASASLAGISLLASYYLYTFVLLKIYGKTHRLIQTLSSLLAAHFIIHLLAFPLLFLAPILAEPKGNQLLALFVGIVYLLMALVLTTWQFLITAQIYKHALELPNLSSLLASFGLLACNILIVSLW